MDDKRLAEIEERAAKGTTGPWYWEDRFNHDHPINHFIRLYTPKNGSCTVMDFTRLGMQNAQPRFSNRSDKPLGGIMINAVDLDLDAHPDAQKIAHAPQDITDLLAEVRLLREALRDIAHGPVGYWNEPQYREKVIGYLMKIATEALK